MDTSIPTQQHTSGSDVSMLHPLLILSLSNIVCIHNTYYNSAVHCVHCQHLLLLSQQQQSMLTLPILCLACVGVPHCKYIYRHYVKRFCSVHNVVLCVVKARMR